MEKRSVKDAATAPASIHNIRENVDPNMPQGLFSRKYEDQPSKAVAPSGVSINSDTKPILPDNATLPSDNNSDLRSSWIARFLVESRIVIWSREPLLARHKISTYIFSVILDVLSLVLSILAAVWVGWYIRSLR